MNISPERTPPRDWPNPPRSFRGAALAFVCALVALLGWFMVVLLAVGGELMASLPIVFTAAFFSLAAGLAISRTRKLRPNTENPPTAMTPHGETGLAFAYSRRRYVWNLSFVGLIAVGLAGYAITGAWAGGTDGLVRAVVCGALAVGSAWIVLSAVRKSPGGIVVTAAGIYHHTPALEQYVPWDAVREVVPETLPAAWIGVPFESMPGVRERTRGGILGKGAGGRPYLMLEAAWLGENAMPAYQCLRYYFENPDRRSELG
ncbi:hypothetical protein [Kineosporia babensis]|uniref:Uncharacterized protein n=1 Tax=Kineosporia babensis TaxID=499548 RepID=A0A9X1SUZ0_9ACTN|nr:hypothetical protein [Kineosporia babensis]MCD5313001.1 hypothetical protein [Kineosporia babensis]